MKKRNGFSFKKEELDFSCHFKVFDNRIVRCYIYDGFLCQTFQGVAKCNVKEGDMFNEEEGKRISFIKATHKRSKTYDNFRNNLLMSVNEVFDDTELIFDRKFEKIIGWEV
jgi:hypothetical protein